jgi:hypothetical protein
MRKGTLERFTLAAIADALDGSDVGEARDSLSAVVGAVVEVSGTVRKRVKRDGQCKLVIEPGASVPGFVVFADCQPDAEKVRRGGGLLVRLPIDRKEIGNLVKLEILKTCQNLTFEQKKTSKNKHLKT